jgi:DNA repair photolyase
MHLKSHYKQTSFSLADHDLSPASAGGIPVGMWHCPSTITENHFVYKSLSNFAFNIAVGCAHACRFCYVPDAATNKQGPTLAKYGVQDPDAQWGDYLLFRRWDESKFLVSLRSAENTPRSRLKPDGNRAIIYCSTTDPYQVVHHPEPVKQMVLANHARLVVRRSLDLIRVASTLNVRILTRSPLAKRDFDLFARFGNRLTFGMSLPTLRNDLASIYEPKAPAPSQRLAALRAAREAGLHVFVALAPTYPECDAADLEATLNAIADLDPITVFHEPINIRAQNVNRIQAHAQTLGVSVNTQVFASPAAWRRYAMESLLTVQSLAAKLGLADRLHSWPDKSLGTAAAANATPKPEAHLRFIHRCWNRISEWPC